MTNAEIMEIITKAHEDGMTKFGLRYDDAEYAIGDACNRSHDWDFENDMPSEDLLDGTCSTGIGYLWFDGEADDLSEIDTALEANNAYRSIGQRQYIIAGTRGQYGDDTAELVIEDAVVIGIIK